MKYLYLIIFALLFIPVDSSAKVRHRYRYFHRHSANDTSMIVKSYTDSLNSYKLKMDSLMAVNDSLSRCDGRFFRLFSPLTFYHSVASHALNINNVDTISTDENVSSCIDSTLMNIYLHRPDLVRNTESAMKRSGTLRQDLDRPMHQRVVLAEKTAPKPEEPENVPLSVIVKRPNFWTFRGDYYLQLLQNYVSDNWYKGGENNYSMVASATIEANYNNKSKLKVDNKLEMKLGFQTTESDTLHKFKTNNDLIRYTGKLGLQASKQWYYTFQLLAYTQFTKGFKSNDHFVYSDFLSPFNLNLSLGMDYTVNTKNKKLTGSINLAPLAYNLKYVGRLALSKRNGLSEGSHTLNDFGSEATINLTWNVCSLFNWQTRLYGYTTYHRVEVEWENTFTMAFSKYISAKVFVYPRFDDGASRDKLHGYWQYKEYASLGLSFSF